MGKQPGYSSFDLTAGVGRDRWSVELFIENAFDKRGEVVRLRRLRAERVHADQRAVDQAAHHRPSVRAEVLAIPGSGEHIGQRLLRPVGALARKSWPRKAATVAAICAWMTVGAALRSPSAFVSGPITAIQMFSEPFCSSPCSFHSVSPPPRPWSVVMMKVV